MFCLDVLFATGIICTVIFVDIYLYEFNSESLPLEDRCSEEYPEFSIVLDFWMTLPDGSLQVSDGTVYPSGASWESGGVVRGCPCTAQTCSMKYCERLKMNYSTVQTEEEPSVTNPPFVRELIWHGQEAWPYGYTPIIEKTNITTNKVEKQNSSANTFDGDDYLFFDNLENGTYLYDYYDSDEYENTNDTLSNIYGMTRNKRDDRYSLDADFIAVDIVNWALDRLLTHIAPISVSERRLEYLYIPQCESYDNEFVEVYLNEEDVMNFRHKSVFSSCFHTREKAFLNSFPCVMHSVFKKINTYNNLHLQKSWRIRFVILALIFHLMTVLVFSTTPHLKTANNKYINCYLLAQIARKIAIVIRYFINISEISKTLDVFIFGVSYYASISSKCWQLAVAHSLWMVFRCQKMSFSRTSFVIYSAFSWMVPLACSLGIILSIDNEDEAEISQLGSIIAFIPGLLAEFGCMVLCGLTVWRLRVWRMGSKGLTSGNSQRHNAQDVRWSILLVKVILIDVGLEHIIFAVLAIARLRYFWSEQPFPLSPVWYKIFDDFNNLRGVQIFIFFVLKKDVWKHHKKRLTVINFIKNISDSSSKSTPKVSTVKSA